jgi:hypothetical protein
LETDGTKFLKIRQLCLSRGIISACWKKLLVWAKQQGYTKADRAAMEIYRSPLGPDNKYKVGFYYPVL